MTNLWAGYVSCCAISSATRAAFSDGDCTLSRSHSPRSLAQSLVDEDDATAASATAVALCQEGEEEGSDAGNVKEESAKDNRSEGGGGDDNEKAERVDGDGEEGDVVCGGGENGGSSIGGGIRPTKSPPMRRKMRRGLRTDIPMSHAMSYT